MEITTREHLHQVDLLSPAPIKITEREYWKTRREQEKLDTLNTRIIADGMKPRITKYQTQKQFLRDAINDISAYALSVEEFQKNTSYCLKLGGTDTAIFIRIVANI